MVQLPAYTEIIIKADSDEEALKILKAINPKTLNWQGNRSNRTTYDI